MDVEAEDDLLLCHPALAVEDLFVAFPGGYGLVLPVRERVGARGGDTYARFFGGPDHTPRSRSSPRTSESVRHTGVRTSSCEARSSGTTRSSPRVRRARRSTSSAPGQSAGLGVDDLVFLLDPEGVIFSPLAPGLTSFAVPKGNTAPLFRPDGNEKACRDAHRMRTGVLFGREM